MSRLKDRREISTMHIEVNKLWNKKQSKCTDNVLLITPYDS